MLATLNEGAGYRGVTDLSLDQRNRWIERPVPYPTFGENYDLILTALLRKDRIRLHPDFHISDFEHIFNLAWAVSEVQDVFSGKKPGQSYMSKASGVQARKVSKLKSAVISTRDLMRNIVEFWRNGGFQESIHAVIARNVLLRIANPDEQQFVSEVFIRAGFFSEWDISDFEHAGITSISEANLRTLKNEMQSSEFLESADTQEMGRLKQRTLEQMHDFTVGLIK
jgi:hypothetical protein